LKIAFYIAKNGTPLDKFIAWWTRPNFFKFWESGKYSHTEIVFDDGWCFSASPREKYTRWKLIDFNENNWDFIQLDDSYNYRMIASHCMREDHKLYDYIGILFTFIVPIDYETKSRWFCSELAAKLVFNFEHSNRYSPNSLYKKIKPYFL
jgi:hypothetical protein